VKILLLLAGASVAFAQNALPTLVTTDIDNFGKAYFEILRDRPAHQQWNKSAAVDC
jgi:hypothetical protein